MVTDVLFPTANVVTVKLAEVCPPGTLTMPGTLSGVEIACGKRHRDSARRSRSAQEHRAGAFVPPLTARRTNRHRLQERWRIRIRTYVDENRPSHAACCCENVSACRETAHCAGSNGEAGCAVSCRDDDSCRHVHIDGSSVVRLTIPPPAGAGIASATLARPKLPPIRS